MSETPENFDVVATIERPHLVNGAPVYLARRDDGAYCLLKEIGGEWSKHGPVVTVETALRYAEHVAAGNPRALTKPDMALTLATAVLSFFHVSASHFPEAPGGSLSQSPDAPQRDDAASNPRDVEPQGGHFGGQSEQAALSLAAAPRTSLAGAAEIPGAGAPPGHPTCLRCAE